MSDNDDEDEGERTAMPNWISATEPVFLDGPRGLEAVRGRSRCTTALALAAAAAILPAPSAEANPRGGRVVGGEAGITVPSADELVVRQGTDRAVINWDSFNIDPGETTRFNQPGPDAITLNRVVGGGDDPSKILGRLEANGHVWLSDPNGVLFGPSAVVDVHGIVATTADIPDQDFLDGAGRFAFSLASPRPDASVINEGSISIGEHGLAGLVAPHVRNDGVITGRLGHVVLAGAPTFTLDFQGDGLIQFATTSEVIEGLDPGRDALVRNDGTISVDGGAVVITADAAAGVVDEVINMAGIVEARAFTVVEESTVRVIDEGRTVRVVEEGPAFRVVEERTFQVVEERTVARQGNGGRIVLLGGDSGTVWVTGTLDASGRQPERRGGLIAVIGNEVRLGDGADLDVTGDAGDGARAVIDGIGTPEGERRLAEFVGGADGVGISEPRLDDDDDPATGGVVMLVEEDAGFAEGNISGIFDLGGPQENPADRNRVLLFEGADVPGEPGDRPAFRLVRVGEESFSVLVDGEERGEFTGPGFGFFLDSRAGGADGGLFFSDPALDFNDLALNPGERRRIGNLEIARPADDGEAGPDRISLAWEDLRPDRSDRDFNDHVVLFERSSFVEPSFGVTAAVRVDPPAESTDIDLTPMEQTNLDVRRIPKACVPPDSECPEPPRPASGPSGGGVIGAAPPHELAGDLLFSNDGNRELWDLTMSETPAEAE